MTAVGDLICTGSYGNATVDLICEKAGVRKGSFYHFFADKSELASVALKTHFEARQRELDSIFSPVVPPLDRLRRLCRETLQWQQQMAAQYGRVVGCPLHSLGAEISSSEPALCKVITGVMELYRRYIESAVRDARLAGLIRPCDPAAKSRMLFAYTEGLLTQARIQNDLGVLKEMESGVMDLVGVETSNRRAA